MRRNISLFLAFILICASIFSTPLNALAVDDIPSLNSISFKNAKLDTKFSRDNQKYTITLENNNVTPTLEKYDISGEAELFINYIYDDTNHQTGITATLQYEAGSRIYEFKYSNPATYIENGNNFLSEIYAPYSELIPDLNEQDNSYDLYIPCDMTNITITPVTSDINAYCAPVTLILNEKQTPTITLSCTASNGKVRDYVISIKRVDKTTDEVEYEMSQKGYESFVDEERLLEKPEVIIIVLSLVGGAGAILALFFITKKKILKPDNNDEENTE